MKTCIQVVTLLGVAWAAAAVDKECLVLETNMFCNNRQLTSVPAGIWPEVSDLYLDQNSISKLYERSFTGFPSVLYLSMNNNQLTDLEWEVFADLPLLEFINLQVNQIHKIDPIPEGIIFNNLRTLALYFNKITSLDPDALLRAPNLEFFLVNRFVVAGHGPVLNHPNLRYLDLQGTEAQALGPASLSGLPKLETISLVSSGITNITGVFVETPLRDIALVMNEGITEVLAGSFYPEEVLLSLALSATGLQTLEVSAVDGAVKSGGTIFIESTPLACSCDYEELYWWALAKGVTLRAQCASTTTTPCHFARRGAAHGE